ncbi:RDD family protein [Anaeromyxobacter terrae]|uniref:RDD family protein n=1 Tax=Anaeromyxobacter terrae TaxID=2925406 RepID=UPI001F56488E|nr:RDD family protein [Anaeromyxobacter sp. SG22]
MLCPRCARETDDRAAFCGDCGAPLTLREEPPPRLLDVSLDLDRRRSRTPAPGAAAPPRPQEPEPLPPLPADPEPVFELAPAPAAPASRSHWDLGRMLEEVAREENLFVEEPAPPPLPRAARGSGAAVARAAPPAAVPQRWPESEPEEEPQAPEGRADRVEVHLRRPAPWRRAAAWAIDAGPLLAGVVFLGRSLLAATPAGLPPTPSGLDGLLDLLAREAGVVLSLAALLAVALAVYATLAHALAGATLGKWMVGLRVVGPDGRRPSLARSAVRAALGGVSAGLLGLGFLLALFTRSGRALHDLLARTWVVEAP